MTRAAPDRLAQKYKEHADRYRQQLANAEREVDQLRARVTELEATQRAICHIHTDSPMGPCPVCVDADALANGDDYTVPYPCPTARLAGAEPCDPPHVRTDKDGPATNPRMLGRKTAEALDTAAAKLHQGGKKFAGERGGRVADTVATAVLGGLRSRCDSDSTPPDRDRA